MIDLDAAVAALRLDMSRLADLERQRINILNSTLNAAMKDERDQELKSDIERQRLRLVRVMREVVEFPQGRRRSLVEEERLTFDA